MFECIIFPVAVFNSEMILLNKCVSVNIIHGILKKEPEQGTTMCHHLDCFWRVIIFNNRLPPGLPEYSKSSSGLRCSVTHTTYAYNIVPKFTVQQSMQES